VADISPLPGEEVVNGSAHHDFQGFSSAGTNVPGWPKLSGDWSVANPAIGSFGEGATRIVVDGTRNGRLVAYDTGADVCAPASWPQFHHDPANSGDLDRDAVAPGVATDAAITDGKLGFTSPGDDLLCGKAARYEVRTSNGRITPSNFSGADAVEAEGEPVDGGTEASLDLGDAELGRWIAVRAVDEQGNVGLPAIVDTGEKPGNPPVDPPAQEPAPTTSSPESEVIPNAPVAPVTKTLAKKPVSKRARCRTRAKRAKLRGKRANAYVKRCMRRRSR
jgi:hypothetical protein